MKDDRVYLHDILERIQRIEAFTKDGRTTFMESLLIQDAVIRNFEVIGEVVKRLSTDLRSQHSDVRWKDIAGFWDILIHDYMNVILAEVWKSCEIDLPPFKSRVKTILDSLNAEE